MPVDLEEVLRSLIQRFRKDLKELGLTANWTILQGIMPVQQQVNAACKQRDGRTLISSKAIVAKKDLKEIYAKLGIAATPGGIQKVTMLRKITRICDAQFFQLYYLGIVRIDLVSIKHGLKGCD
jgi:hypothetical protein